MCSLSQSSKPGLDLLSDTPSEEDGLFTTKPTSTARQPKASVPPPTSSKAKQAAPIDEDLTLEDDGLFTAKPISTVKQPKATASPSVTPKTQKTAPTDDLFAAPVDSGPQTSPDVSSEPAKPQKKKPAGAVSMFGGVDLFGGGGLGTKATTPPTSTAAPSVEEKQETAATTAPVETKKSIGGIINTAFILLS